MIFAILYTVAKNTVLKTMGSRCLSRQVRSSWICIYHLVATI